MSVRILKFSISQIKSDFIFADMNIQQKLLNWAKTIASLLCEHVNKKPEHVELCAPYIHPALGGGYLQLLDKPSTPIDRTEIIDIVQKPEALARMRADYVPEGGWLPFNR